MDKILPPPPEFLGPCSPSPPGCLHGDGKKPKEDKDQRSKRKVEPAVVLERVMGTFEHIILAGSPVGPGVHVGVCAGLHACVPLCTCVAHCGRMRCSPRNAEADPSYSLTWLPQPWFFSIPTDETLLYVLFTSCLDYHNCLLAGPTCLSSPMGSKCC